MKNTLGTLIGHVCFVGLLVLSIVWSEQRVLFIDSSYQLFSIIQSGNFNIEANRFSTIIPQLIPLLAVKFNVGLATLVSFYSFSYMLTFYFVFIICAHVFRDLSCAWVIILSLVMLSRMSFFHTVTETHQALTYTGGFWAWLGYMTRESRFSNISPTSGWFWAGMILALLALFSHPIAIFTLLFSVGYFLIDVKAFKKNVYVFLPSLLVIVLFIPLKYLITPSNSYEGNFIANLMNLPALLNHFHTLYSWWFVRAFHSIYQLGYYLFALLLIIYIATKQWKKLTYVALGVTFFYFFSILVYSNIDSGVMMERAFLPVGLCLLLPVSRDLIFKKRFFYWIGIPMLIVILFISIKGISQSAGFLQKRLAYMEQLYQYTTQMGESKYLLSWEKLDNRIVYVPWSFSIETLMYTRIHHPGNLRSFYVSDDKFPPGIFETGNYWLGASFNEIRKHEYLNKEYFPLKPTPYKDLRDFTIPYRSQ